jgi:anti-anti-sigma regulatory factor
MSLKITQNNGTFEVAGKINTATSKSFKLHFDFILNSRDKLTIDINKVNEINVCGARVLKELYRKAILNNKTFSILGAGSKESTYTSLA